jgi:hypothetical protein
MFTTWAAFYADALDAVTNRSWDKFFISKIQNNKDMETSFTKLGNITNFLDWLKNKADNENEGNAGALQFCIGGN